MTSWYSNWFGASTTPNTNDTPVFKNFGQSYTNLAVPLFHFTNEVKVKSITQQGVGLETTFKHDPKLFGSAVALKVIDKHPKIGTMEATFDSDGQFKGSVERNYYNTVLKLTGDRNIVGAFDVAYRANGLALSSTLNVNANKLITDFTAAYGRNGLSVGTGVAVDPLIQNMTDYNIGAEYVQPTYAVTVKTAEIGNKIGSSFVYHWHPDVSLGTAFMYNLTNPQDGMFTVISSFALDRDTTTKFKLMSDGFIAGALEQKLANPRMRYGLSAEYNLKSMKPGPERFGLSLGFGEP